MSRCNEWTCDNCTFHHKFIQPRCVMCCELRNASRQQMRDFITGKSLKKNKAKNNNNNNDNDNDNDNGDENGDDDDDDEVMIVEPPPPPPPRGPTKNASAASTIHNAMTAPGGTAQHATGTSTSDASNFPAETDKENQRQNIAAPASALPLPVAAPSPQARPPPPPSANSFFAAPRPPVQKSYHNPYLSNSNSNSCNKKSASASSSTNASGSSNAAASQPIQVSNARIGPASKAAVGPSTTSSNHNSNNGDDPWQHVSTATAQSRALPLHPQAPSRQSPVPAAVGPTAHNALTVLKDPSPLPLAGSHCVQNSSTASTTTTTTTSSRSSKKGPAKKNTTKSKSLKTPFVMEKPVAYSKGPVPYCPEACKTWIYPQHPEYPPRQYQVEMTETAVHHNTLVSLPTGLGKTLIAAVVMYNYWRWFPTGKIIFLAPTLPLVNQQVQACYKIMGIPGSVTAVMTGKLSREKRMEYWKERRVFYCTPQTVQKDLVEKQQPQQGDDENNETEAPVASSFTNQIVCLVLDEAHKATGEYAYVKVIEQLEAAGAKFRIVGLSATPGTSIKAIQQVVGALRTHRIEARNEANPTVQPYLHTKISEIIIVPRNDSQRQVERQLTNMLTPMLEELRQQGAMRLHGNASLTPFQILQAKQLYEQRHGGVPGHLASLFAAAQHLVSLRNEAHQSLGVIRSKLMRLINEPQRGILSRIVKGQDFKDLFALVTAATSAGNDQATLSQQHATIRNNPKLIKLSELLKEHFLRAQACGKSSRVIIFSQFRDSVHEIVLLLRTLEPAIRPHQFVGQGKPPKGSTNKHSGGNGEDGGQDSRLGGMKQSEQQKVIQEFRNNIYNVLVCTCIGEEGLDIGEVDLIVNFDTLRSPIRMIQRTGRTGRARDGRVVCLISEGQEQRTFEQSKQAEKTLMRALEKKSNFTMHPDIPLFPVPPKERQYVIMEIGSQLHMSQVAGANSTATRKSNGGTGSKTTKFKLDTAQEEERQQRLGKLSVVDTNATPWRTLRRVLIRHRSIRQSQGGRTMRMLQPLERLGPIHEAAAAAANTSAKTFRMNAGIYKIFPVEKTPESDRRSNMVPDKITNDGLDGPNPIDTSTATPNQLSSTNSSCEAASAEQPLPLPPHVLQVPDAASALTERILAASRPMEERTPATSTENSLPQPLRLPDEVPAMSANNTLCLPENQRPVAATIQEVAHAPLVGTAPQSPFPVHPPQGVLVDGQNAETIQPANQGEEIADLGLDLQVDVVVQPFVESNFDEKGTEGVSEPTMPVSGPVFRLPTPPPSSSEDEGDDDGESHVEQIKLDLQNNRHLMGHDAVDVTDAIPAGSVGAEPLVVGVSSPNSHSPDGANVTFRLPTQPSSSEEEDSSEDETGKDIDKPAVATTFPRAESMQLPEIENRNVPSFTVPSSVAVINDALCLAELADDDTPLIALQTTKRKHTKSSSQKKPKKPRKDAVEKSPGQSFTCTCDQQFRTSKSAHLHSSPSPEITARLKRKKRLFVVDDGESQPDPAFDQTPLHSGSMSVGDILQDTPDDLPARIQPDRSRRESTPLAQHVGAGQCALTDTPLALNPSSSANTPQIDAARLSCQVCFSRESLDEDPLIICDGCELGFHKSCFSIEVSLDSNEPWYCDLCTSRNEGFVEDKACTLCGIESGAMKRHGISWCHPICRHFLSSTTLTSRPCLKCSCDGGARCFSCTSSMHPYCAIHKPQSDHWTIVMVKPTNSDGDGKATLFCPAHVNNANNFISLHAADDKAGPLPSIRVIQTRKLSAPGRKLPKTKRLRTHKDSATNLNVENSTTEREGASRLARLENLKRRRAGASKFVLEEAEIDSGEDPDGDEDDDVRRLEDDEHSHDSFINDSTDLTQHFSQDHLADVDPDASTEVDFHHRALDAERARDQQYKTPLLNRRMNRSEDSQFSSSSQKGLGNMHFVRSVLEHHRQGGRCEEIEEYYRQMAKDDQSYADLSQTSTA